MIHVQGRTTMGVPMSLRRGVKDGVRTPDVQPGLACRARVSNRPWQADTALVCSCRHAAAGTALASLQAAATVTCRCDQCVASKTWPFLDSASVQKLVLKPHRGTCPRHAAFITTSLP